MKEYDPTKPFNKQTIELVEGTWGNAKNYIVDIFREGKRSVYNERQWGYRANATDGIGTKAFLHWQMYKGFRKSLKPAAQDAAAMVLDDLAELGAVPYRLEDHIVIQEEDEKAIYELMAGLVDVCNEHDVVITGGETAICDNIRGFEMGVTATGGLEDASKRTKLKSGDVLIGLRSSGIHSNGLTFARHVFGLGTERQDKELQYTLHHRLPWGRMVGEELTVPTTIYCDDLLRLKEDAEGQVHGMVHITGGGWTKLKELDETKRLDFHMDGRNQEPHLIFSYLKHLSKSLGNVKPLTDSEMYKKFNCGTGFVVAVDQRYVEGALDVLEHHDPRVIGEVKKGAGRIKIKSAFSKREVVF